jgi:prefoldin subunit 5
MGLQERARNRERVDKDETIKHLQATILAYSKRINKYELQVDELYQEIHELIEKIDK